MIIDQLLSHRPLHLPLLPPLEPLPPQLQSVDGFGVHLGRRATEFVFCENHVMLLPCAQSIQLQVFKLQMVLRRRNSIVPATLVKAYIIPLLQAVLGLVAFTHLQLKYHRAQLLSADDDYAVAVFLDVPLPLLLQT